MLTSIIIGIAPNIVAIASLISSGILSKSFKAIPSTPFLWPVDIIKYRMKKELFKD